MSAPPTRRTLALMKSVATDPNPPKPWVLPILAAVLLVVSACASPPASREPIEPSLTRQMFAKILRTIDESYIDAPDIGSLTLAALESINEIDPALTVDADEGTSLLIAGDEAVGRWDWPPEGSAEDWAAHAADVLTRARTQSPVLGEAGEEAVFETVFGAMVGLLDRYSRYAGAVEARSNRESRQGFGGIGVTVGQHPLGVRIVSVSPDSPAQAAGLHVGDIVTTIDGKPVAGSTIRQAVRMLRGPIEKSILLTLQREGLGTPLKTTVGRTHIVPNTVFFRPRGDVAVIRITAFNDRTPKRVAEAMSEARAALGDGMNGVVLDLRGNPGGLLEKAIEVADLFLHAGLISSTDGRHALSHQRFEAEPGDISGGESMVLLIDGATASAAEVLAAALQDQRRAVLIGASSFGKGSVQTVLDLPNGGELILTWARLIAPSGYTIHEAGVIPTVCAQGSENAAALLRHVLLVEPATTLHNLSVRRRTKANDRAGKAHLNTICPWRPNEDAGTAEEAGLLLLRDTDLYQSAIALSLPPAS